MIPRNLRLASCLAIIALPSSVWAQSSGSIAGSNFRQLDISKLGYGGGRIGVSIQEQIYQIDGVNCVKVAAVDTDTRFSRIRAGDCIYYISYKENGVEYGSPFLKTSDFMKLAQAFYPSAVISIYFYSGSRGYQLDGQTAQVVARQTMAQSEQRPVYAPQPSYQTPPPRPVQPSYPSQATYQPRYSQPSQRTSNAAQDQANLNRAIESIIQSDARGWWVHKFDPGSVSGAYIRASSPDGSTQIARAYYTYSGGARDWIDVKVSNGQLVCVEYGGELSSCRSVYDPNKSASYAGAIVAAVVVAVVIAASSSRSSNGSSSYGPSVNSGAGDYPPPRTNDSASSSSSRPREDTSIGCAWGDRAYGTCH